MKQLHTMSKSGITRLALLAIIAAVMFAGVNFWNSSSVTANHAVLVEGEQDFDGDGLLGTAEDVDGTDQVFGTIAAALGSANAGANQNGRVTIVTSGRFLSSVQITAANGHVTLEGAPGVEANIEAVRAGDAGNAMRQTVPGIVVAVPDAVAANRIVTIRNIVSRNWTEGIVVMGNSRVIIDNCRIENNTNFGIRAMGGSRVTVNNSQVTASGFRTGAAPVVNTPMPGTGIRYEGTATGTVAFTMVSSSVAAGISNGTSRRDGVRILQVNVFDNATDFDGIRPPKDSVPAVRGSVANPNDDIQ